MTIIDRKETAPVFILYNDGNLVPQTVSTSRSFYLDRPDANKRPKPTDLFRAATARIVTSKRVDYTYGDLRDLPSRRTGVTAPYSYWGLAGFNPGRLSIPMKSDFASLDNKVRSKIKAQNVNLAQAMAEYKQTSSLFVSLSTDLVRVFHTIRSGRKKRDFIKFLKSRKTRSGKRTANRWLEYQFGIVPLMSDLKGSSDAIQKRLSQGFHLFARAKATDSGIAIDNSLGPSVTKTVRIMKTVARYDISAPGLKTLGELGLLNPAAVAWELVPWSFVIDWFIDVGDYLSGLDALVGVSDLVVHRSYYRVMEFSGVRNHVDRYQAFTQYPTAKGLEITTGRLGVSNDLSFGRLRFEPSLSAKRVANAVALLRQLKR